MNKESSQTVINDDCLNAMEGIETSSVDVVVTSPPYNIGIKYNEYKDSLTYEEYLEWIRNIGIEIKRILKDDGSLFLNIGGTSVNPWIPIDVASALREVFVLQNRIIWTKSISIGDNPENSHGHYKPINSKRFVNNLYEDLFHFTKTGNVKIDRLAVGLPYKWKSNRKNRKTGEIGKDKKCRGNVWFIPYRTVQSKSQKHNHPASYPVELPERCIKLHGIKENMLVIDPFLGIGSTLIACKKLSVNGIGIDTDKDYCEISKNRLSEEESLFT